MNTGAMIAHFPAPEITSRLSVLARQHFGERAEPEQDMHLTLFFLGEAAELGGDDAMEMENILRSLSERLAPMPASINGITRFLDNDPNAMVVNFDAPGLNMLRLFIQSELTGQGIKPASNHGFTPHITLAYWPADQAMPDVHFDPIPITLDSITLAVGDDRKIFPLRGSVALSEAKRMAAKPLSESGVYDVSASETTLHQSYISAPLYSVEDERRFPEVPVAPGVDIATLTAGDPNPVYVTRPLAILGEVSENGLPYNEAVVRDVYTQVMTKRPVARRGHVSEADKSSLFPLDDAYWIGAVMDSSVYGKPTVFGKCYVVPGETREMILRRKATGTALSNSLYGDVITTVDEDGMSVPIGVEIESIDFVPAERAALQALGGDFKVTSEMKKSEEIMADEKTGLKESIAALKPSELHEMMSDNQRHHVAESHLKTAACSECTDAAVKEMLSESRRASVAEMYLGENAKPEETYKQMSEAMRKGIAEAFARESNMRLVPQEAASATETQMSEMRQSLTEMSGQLKAYQTRVFNTDLDKAVDAHFAGFHVTTDNGIKGLTNLKDELRFRAMSEMAGMKGGHVVENIPVAANSAWEHLKPLVEMFISTAGGPSAIVGTMDNGAQSQDQYGYDPKTGQYSTTAAANARAKASF